MRGADQTGFSISETVIMAGIPGSGKSTRVAKEYPGILVLSTDDYFVNEDGGYNFDKSKIGEAHAWNLRRFMLEVMHRTDEPIRLVIDNTNLSLVEIAPYYQISECVGIRARVEHILCDLHVAQERQTHGVPEDVMERLWESSNTLAESLPPWWSYKALFAGGKVL